MGNGNLVDGVRRWFHRRPASSSKTGEDSGNSSSDKVNNSNRRADASQLLTGSSNGSISSGGDEVADNPEFDVSTLSLVKVPKRNYFNTGPMAIDPLKKGILEKEFFTEYGEANRYQVQEVVGKGSYGVVGSAIDTQTGEKVAIKKINDVFEHVSDATRILREIKLLRLLRHPDVVEIKHIMLPPSRREFKDIYVVFELMESDLHQVIRANHDLTPQHFKFFLYQLLRGLKYVHAANVFHRDLKPKNILANADCKLKICDFGLARVSFNDAPSAIFWTDYVATRWYRAPELCGSFFSKYTPAIDIWSVGCIFAELLSGKPVFPGKNVVHQLDLITDLLGTPPAETIAKIRNEKARRYLGMMRKKHTVPLEHKFPKADPLALRLLERLLAFDPNNRLSAEEALADPYFHGLANIDWEPSTEPISKMEFDFERRKPTKDDIRELIYREILEYHPQMLEEYLNGDDQISFMYPRNKELEVKDMIALNFFDNWQKQDELLLYTAKLLQRSPVNPKFVGELLQEPKGADFGVDRFKRQFAHMEEHYSKGERSTPLQFQRKHASLPRERVCPPKDESAGQTNDDSLSTNLQSPTRTQNGHGAADNTTGDQQNEDSPCGNHSARSFTKSASISASKCVVVKGTDTETMEESISDANDEGVDDLAQKFSAL